MQFKLSGAALALFVMMSSPALAQEGLDKAESGGSSSFKLGVGMETQLALPLNLGGAIRAVFDFQRFRAEALLSLLSNNDLDVTTFGLGARFFYVLHKAKGADFSAGLGGTLGVIAVDGGDDDFRGILEVLAQIRVWVVKNVALTGNLGLGVAIGGDTSIQLGGQLSGGFGLAYFF